IPEANRTSEQHIAFVRCKEFADRVFYERGYVYVGSEEDPEVVHLREYCPWNWTAPMGGPYVYLLTYWDRHGMSEIEGRMSAEAAAARVFRKQFPHCPTKRAEAGIPAVTVV